ncbi:hypothetical protein HKD37_07G019295 [Glycine soja]
MRQENRTQENALAPSWWIPFKYKLTQILIDERDGSIFAAIFEWIDLQHWLTFYQLDQMGKRKDEVQKIGRIKGAHIPALAEEVQKIAWTRTQLENNAKHHHCATI